MKLFIFTVQSLIKPETKAGRRTHKFQEGLGEAFYGHLQGLADLAVFADEHHAYYAPAFSTAVRNLAPRVLIGLTATPHRNTPRDQIIYQYPLAAAIAEQLVKTPVLVGRKDDRSDPRTKLLDGVRLLEDSDEIACWVRLQTGDVPILWQDKREYNPDFVAIETNGAHWLIESKMDKEMESEDVQGKRHAALRWANHVNDAAESAARWGYLLVSETDIKTAKGSWPALKRLGAAT